MSAGRLEVLWVYHSAVVSAWRRTRVDALAGHGVDLTVVSAPRWNEGGAVVELEVGADERVTSARTVGSHPFLFAYDPRPIRRLLAGRRFDVIDVHEEPASLALAEVLAIRGALRLDTPVVCYSAQNLPKRYPLPFRWFEQRALGRVRAVHTCNDEVEGVLRSKGFGGEVVNLGLGIDLERFAPTAGARAVGTVGGPVQVLYVGRLEARKGIFTLLGAARELGETEVRFVGAGPDAAGLEAAIVAEGLTGRVSVEGFVAHDGLPGLYRSADVVVVPSISNASWTEQFGRVAVEAMASGTPVVVSDAGSLPEVVGDAALVVPEDDVGALADALGRLCGDPTLRATLRARGLERARYFSWDRIAADQAALYRRVLG